MAIWPFGQSRADTDASALLNAVVAASRRPVFFGENKAPDTLEGRFEVIALHAALALLRLRAVPEAAPMAQLFTDKLFRDFDAGLREAGIGDMSVPKRMHALAGAFYGRLKAYEAGLKAGDAAALEAVIGRNVLAGETVFAPALARYALALLANQAALPADALLSAQGWALDPR